MAIVYEYSSYKEFLRELIQENSGQRGYQASLARAAGCQSSYLSQVLTGKAELLADHAANLAPHIGLNSSETEYLIELVHLARATSPELKKYVSHKLEKLKEKKSELAERIPGAKRILESIESFYFSSWHWSAIHMATSVPSLQTAEAIATRFHLSLTRVLEVLEKLENCGFVKFQNKKWIYEKGAGHLPKQSIMTELNHTHWRQRALLNVQENLPDDLHYTSVFSMSQKDAEKLNEFLVKAIAGSRNITDPSNSEEVFCFNIDFFKI